MRKWLTIAGGGLMVASCGGGSGSNGVAVVSGAPAATPTPTPTPAATPTPTPTPTPTAPAPTSSYPRYGDLTGNRTFQTACASLLAGTPPIPQPATGFGEGPTLDYTAAGAWTINGDGAALSFAASDAVTAASGQRSYERTVAGSVQRFTITDPVAGGSTLDYLRSFALRADRAAGTTLYSCVFGVPATTADVPAAAIGYARVGVNGTAYVADQNGTVQTYTLTASTATASFDPAANALVVKVHLLGNLQTSGGTAAATVDLGTFSGNGVVDAARGKFFGQLDSSDRVSLFSSLSGWFFGATEAGVAFEVLAADPATGNRVSAVGTVVAAR